MKAQLPPHLSNLWQIYESSAIRAQKLVALDRFVNELLREPTESWYEWARGIAERVVDDREEISLPMPLLSRVIFPALRAGYELQLRGYARWLAGLLRHLSRCRECLEQLPPESRSEIGLLRTAIKHDPADLRSKRMLLDSIARELEFSLHELPAGVLHGMNGATAEQCQELIDEVETAAAISSELGSRQYHQLIADARFHFQCYRDYLLSKVESSYHQYFQQRCSEAASRQMDYLEP